MGVRITSLVGSLLVVGSLTTFATLAKAQDRPTNSLQVQREPLSRKFDRAFYGSAGDYFEASTTP